MHTKMVQVVWEKECAVFWDYVIHLIAIIMIIVIIIIIIHSKYFAVLIGSNPPTNSS